jgi:L-2-hydroxyglutarate oxidase LhgO
MRIAVIGAGVVGLACARELAQADHELYVLEAGPRIGEGVTSRNSGVIHSPLNYAGGTLKAELCAQGRELLYDWCKQTGVPHRQTGKLIVATTAEEETQLDRILQAAQLNGANEVRIIDKKQLHRLEPLTQGTAAIFSPRTGIIDPYELTRSFLLDAEKKGATLIVNAKVQAVTTNSTGYLLGTTLGPIESDAVINSAGLYADEIATLACAGQYTVHPWRGDYFSFRPGRGRAFSHLIYPVKLKSDPGLGVHLTVDLAGNYRLGPDVEYGPSKEDFSPHPQKLQSFLGAARKLFPWAEAEMLAYDTCGIRPKLRAPNDNEEKDFVISQDRPGWINLVGIESPGLTASMAIATRVRSLLGS